MEVECRTLGEHLATQKWVVPSIISEDTAPRPPFKGGVFTTGGENLFYNKIKMNMINIEKYMSANPLTAEQQSLLVSNLNIATMMACVYRKQAKTKGVSFDEVVSESNMGLLIAVQQYVPGKGGSLSVFATNWCKKAILALLNDDSVFESLDINPESEDSAEELLGLTTETDEIQQEKSAKVQALMNVLNPQEYKVINLLFGLDGQEMSVAEVAKVMGVMPARIRQVRDKALGKMRG